MEDLRLRGKTRMSVPQFGGWDGKTRDETNYSVVFSQARANRKKHKDEFVSHSLGNEREFFTKHHNDDYPPVKTRMSVPQFGGWDGKTRDETNYSVVFSQARANRKKHKDEFVSHSLGNEREFFTKHHNDDYPPVVRSRFLKHD